MPVNNYLVLFLSILAIVLGVYLRVRRNKKSKKEKEDKREVLEIQLSRSDDQKRDIQASSLSAENMFSALHGLLKSDPDLQEHISLEMVASGERGIRFYVTAPSSGTINNQFSAHPPTERSCQIRNLGL